MGRKIHPVGFRLKVNRDWDARWYAEGNRYKDALQEDFRIRRFILGMTDRAGISRVEIERYPNQLLVNIHTARPGIVIGRKGEAVKQLRQDLEALTDGKKVKVEVTEIDKPDVDAYLIAENIAGQLQRRIGHSRGIEVSGRLAGADMARREWQSEGRIPRNTLRADVDYGTAEALTTFGRIGIKVWVYKGDVLDYDAVLAERVKESAGAASS
jgi:small subunit ribosomal protein S3